MITNSAPLLSGLAVQQKYGISELSGQKTNKSQTRTTVTPFGDTVQISSEAWELFRTQTADDTADTQSSAGDDDNRMAASGNTAETFESRISVDEEISQLESEISSLLAEIGALEEKSVTDELAAAVLRSKQARLETLQAILTGLLAKSYQSG